MQLLLNMGQRPLVICCESFLMNMADGRSVPLEEMQARFGDESIWVYNILRGIDHSEGTPLS
jgi:DNA polymerase eta